MPGRSLDDRSGKDGESVLRNDFGRSSSIGCCLLILLQSEQNLQYLSGKDGVVRLKKVQLLTDAALVRAEFLPRENEGRMSLLNYHQRWQDIHTRALAIQTQQDKLDYLQFLQTITGLIPCGTCRYHYQKYLQEHPPTVEQDLFVWAWELHNSVNARIGKPQVTLEAAYELYRKSELQQ